MRIHFDFVLTSEQFIKAAQRNNQRFMRALPAYWLIQLSAIALVASLVFMLHSTTDLLQGKHMAAIIPVWVAVLIALLALVLYSALAVSCEARLIYASGQKACMSGID